MEITGKELPASFAKGAHEGVGGQQHGINDVHDGLAGSHVRLHNPGWPKLGTSFTSPGVDRSTCSVAQCESQAGLSLDQAFLCAMCCASDAVSPPHAAAAWAVTAIYAACNTDLAGGMVMLSLAGTVHKVPKVVPHLEQDRLTAPEPSAP